MSGTLPSLTTPAAGTAPSAPNAPSAPPGQGTELVFMPATELAARLRRKEVSAREVLSAHIAQIERVNPRLNAIVTTAFDRAMSDARRADDAMARGTPLGALHGLPIAHKDLVETEGIRTTRGSPFYRDFVPTQDAPIIRRMRAAGAVTLGKTNTPEFGAGSHTFNTVFGRHPQSVRYGEDVWRQQRRGGGSPRQRHDSHRRWQRHRWQSPQSGRVL